MYSVKRKTSMTASEMLDLEEVQVRRTASQKQMAIQQSYENLGEELSGK